VRFLLALAVAAVVLGVSMWWLNTQWAGKHVTKCGFDSQGLPYAVVRDNTIGGAKRDSLVVQFNYDNRFHNARQSAAGPVRLPTLFGHPIGGATTVVHGTWPKQAPNGPQKKLYCVLGPTGNNDYN
jgi:hypothetical protein